jgi:hypothetical protein
VDACIITSNATSGIFADHADATITRSTVTTSGASGILADNGATLTVAETTVSGNGVYGIYAYGGSTANISRSIVRNNQATGLALFGDNYSVTNSLIVKNGIALPTTVAGGVDLRPSSSGTMLFVNNTVADNTAGGSMAGGVSCTNSGTVVNSILWGNSGAEQSGCTVSYSDVEGGTTANGNITGNPRFLDAANGNYYLELAPTPSPGINAGTASGAPTVDLEGYARSGNPDMGCYEAH